jgi:hypothetical protein
VRIVSIACENGVEILGKVFIDATYEGDLLAFAGLSYVVGREGNVRYGETKNGIHERTEHQQLDRRVDPFLRPGDPASGLIYGVAPRPMGAEGDADEGIQGYCFRLCLTRAANRIAIARPVNYDPAQYELQRRYLAAGGRIAAPSPAVPNGKTDPGSWHVLAGNFTGFNHRYPVASYAERAAMLQASRDHIQGLYWFLANAPEVPSEIRRAWSAWGLATDEFIDNAGWPRAFYVRNGRRLVGDFVLTEAHLRRENPLAVVDPVGLIWWPPDLHAARCVANDGVVRFEGAVFEPAGDAAWRPCGIPYAALVPKADECVNLLSPTCPSASYVAYGAYRIEFTFMAAGQAVATAAALCVEDGGAVQAVDRVRLRMRLMADGQILTPTGGPAAR